MTLRRSELIKQAALFHSSGFLCRNQEIPGTIFLDSLSAECNKGNVLYLENQEADTAIYYEHLPWDSQYFQVPTYKIQFLASSQFRSGAIKEYCGLLEQFASKLGSMHDRFYVFTECPAEVLDATQSFCLSGWKMIETRLTYFNNSIQQFNYPHRFAVREATSKDIPNLRGVASTARNNFDRYHADCFFSSEVADNYLATFVENSVKGFADVTLVPDSDKNEPGAFLTGKFLPVSVVPNQKMAQMVLSAVSEKRRGWYVKLISEMSYLLKDKGFDICFMSTQSTNKAVIRTWEKLGYSYGKSSHIFVKTSGNMV